MSKRTIIKVSEDHILSTYPGIQLSHWFYLDRIRDKIKDTGRVSLSFKAGHNRKIVNGHITTHAVTCECCGPYVEVHFTPNDASKLDVVRQVKNCHRSYHD